MNSKIAVLCDKTEKEIEWKESESEKELGHTEVKYAYMSTVSEPGDLSIRADVGEEQTVPMGSLRATSNLYCLSLDPFSFTRCLPNRLFINFFKLRDINIICKQQ